MLFFEKIRFHSGIVIKDLNTCITGFWKNNKNWVAGILLSFFVIILSVPFLISLVAMDNSHDLFFITIVFLSVVPASIGYISKEVARRHFFMPEMRHIPLDGLHWFSVKAIYLFKLHFFYFLINLVAILLLFADPEAKNIFFACFKIILNVIVAIYLCSVMAQKNLGWITGFVLLLLAGTLVFSNEFLMLIVALLLYFFLGKILTHYGNSLFVELLQRSNVCSIVALLLLWFFLFLGNHTIFLTAVSIILVASLFFSISEVLVFLNLYSIIFNAMPLGDRVLKTYCYKVCYCYLAVAILSVFIDIFINNFSALNIVVMTASFISGLVSLIWLKNYLVFLQILIMVIYTMSIF